MRNLYFKMRCVSACGCALLPRHGNFGNFGHIRKLCIFDANVSGEKDEKTLRFSIFTDSTVFFFGATITDLKSFRQRDRASGPFRLCFGRLGP